MQKSLCIRKFKQGRISMIHGKRTHTSKMKLPWWKRKRKTHCEQKMVSFKLLGSIFFFFLSRTVKFPGDIHMVWSLSLDPIYNHVPWYVHSPGEVLLLSYCTVTPVQRSVKSSISSPSSLYMPSTCWLTFRPGNFSENHQLQGQGSHSSFKLVPKNKRIIQPREMFAMLALRTPREAKEKGPQKASETKDPPNPGEVRKTPKMPDQVKKALPLGEAKERAPRKAAKPRSSPHPNPTSPWRSLPAPLGSAGSPKSKAAPTAKMLRPPGKEKL